MYRMVKICQVTRLAWVFLCCCLFLESPENLYTNWTYLRELPSRRTPSYIHSYSCHSSLKVTRVLLAELEKFVRIVHTILAGFVLFHPLRTNFGACNKFTTGLTVDYVN